MKNRSQIAALVFAGSLMGSALAQDPAPKQAPSSALARIQSTFRAADADKDQSISGREAGRAGIPTRDFAAHDTDRDRKLSEGEFLLYYRFLLVKAQRPVDKDIEAEVARIQAARRARQAEDAKKEEPAPKVEKPLISLPIGSPRQAPRIGADSAPQEEPGVASAKPADSAPGQGRVGTSERLRRARASLSEANAGDTDASTDASVAERASAMRLKQRSAEMRAKLARDEEQRRKAAAQKNQDQNAKVATIGTDDAKAATDAAELERRTEAMRLKTRSANMRAKLEQEQKAEEAKQAELARRAEAMRLKTRSDEMRKKQDGQAGKIAKQKPQGADPKSPGARAQRYAVRFVEAGLMSAEEGRELSEALSSGRIAALDPAQRSSLLNSLSSARERVDKKLAAGKIDKKEAASLRQLLDGHSKALNPKALNPKARDRKPAQPAANRGSEDGAKPGVRGAPKEDPQRPQEKPKPARDKDKNKKKGRG